MSTLAPRNGTPSASSSRRCRAPLASQPSAGTMRCQGSPGSSLSATTVPAEGGPAGDTSPYARTNPGGVLRMRSSTRRARTDPVSMPTSCALMRHGTYSIVAYDPATGEHGAAVQSHWFSVGSLCIWARPGIGAVATQSVVEPAHGPNALDRLAAGDDAEAALAGVLAPDPLASVRQVGVVDGDGR